MGKCKWEYLAVDGDLEWWECSLTNGWCSKPEDCPDYEEADNDPDNS